MALGGDSGFSVPSAVPRSSPAPAGPDVSAVSGMVTIGTVASKLGASSPVVIAQEGSQEWGPRKVIASEAGAVTVGESSSGGAPAIGLTLSTFIDRTRKKIVEAGEFPPFRVTLWQRGKDGLLEESMRAGGLGDVEIPVGLYVFTFNTPGESPYASDVPIPIEAGGKSARVERLRVYPDGRTVVLVRLLENPIPLLVLIGAAAVGIGIAGFGLASALESVDRVVVDTTDQAVKVGLIGAAGFLGYVVLKRMGVF